MPIPRLLVFSVAVPEPLRALEPSSAAPSRNVTVPVGMTLSQTTDAVSVTCRPTAAGFGDADSNIVDGNKE